MTLNMIFSNLVLRWLKSKNDFVKTQFSQAKGMFNLTEVLSQELMREYTLLVQLLYIIIL